MTGKTSKTKNTKKQSDELVDLLAQAMRGLAYWMGWQHSIFRHYPLPEGAIVAELSRLIAAHLPDKWTLALEFPIEKVTEEKVNGRGRRPAFDLAILKAKDLPVACIEVKRWPKGDQYEKDVDKLRAAMKTGQKEWSGFVLVASDKQLPEKLVTDKGHAQRGITKTKKKRNEFRVRRVCKAMSTGKPKSTSGHWVCLLEVVRPSR